MICGSGALAPVEGSAAVAVGDGLTTTSAAAYAASPAAPARTRVRRASRGSGRGSAASTVWPMHTTTSALSSATFDQYSVRIGAISSVATTPIDTA